MYVGAVDRRVILNFYSICTGLMRRNSKTGPGRTRAISAHRSDLRTRRWIRKRIATNSTRITPVDPAAIGDASAAFDPLSSRHDHGADRHRGCLLAQDRKRMIGYADSVAKGVQDYLRIFRSTAGDAVVTANSAAHAAASKPT